MSNKIIEIKNLSKKYGKEKILNEVSLSFERGQIVGLCGPNGTGKTTLIKVLVGLLRDYKGEVLFEGQPLGVLSRANISYLPDIEYLSGNITGLKAAALHADMYDDFDVKLMEELFTKMQLDGEMRVNQMSKGMREKFQLALCLARKADVYILDEPIAGVDPASRDQIIETIIENYTKDSLLLIATHLIQDIEAVLDEVVFIKGGEILLHESCEDLREKHGKSIDQIFREEFRW